MSKDWAALERWITDNIRQDADTRGQPVDEIELGAVRAALNIGRQLCEDIHAIAEGARHEQLGKLPVPPLKK